MGDRTQCGAAKRAGGNGTTRTLPMVLCAVGLLACGRGGKTSDMSTNAAQSGTLQVESTEEPGALLLARLTDDPLDPARRRLLSIAAAAAGKLPTVPHGKNRSRLQEVAASSSLALGQRRSALEQALSIEGWQRGAVLADLATVLAEGGDQENARLAIDMAQAEHDRARTEELQEWRADRVLARIGRARVTLGETLGSGDELQAIDPAEHAPLALAQAARLDVRDFDAQLAELRRLAATGDFAMVRNALLVAGALHDRFYEDTERRTELAEFVTSSWRPLPVDLQLELLTSLSEAATRHGDEEAARAYVARAAELLAALTFTPEAKVPVLARVAVMHWRAGLTDRAAALLGQALAEFDAGRTRIFDVFRADTLRPLAQAHATIGEQEAALSVYRQAVEEGGANPNSRPRAEDLVETCCSLAETGLVPDEALLQRLAELEAGLGDPW